MTASKFLSRFSKLRRFAAVRSIGAYLRRAAVTAATAAVLTGFAAPASAQLVAMVNGEPITALDVTQRTQLMLMIERKRPSRQAVIEELIDERLKLQEARRLNITISDADVDRAFAGIAQQSGRTAAEFTAAFRQSQIDIRSFKSRLRAEFAWRQVLQQAAPGAFYVRDADVVAALSARGQDINAKATQYTLQQFVFVVPRTAPASARAARTREAQAFRSKIADCEHGLQLAREYPEVVARDRVIRISTDLPARLQQLLEKTPDGKTTPPEPTTSGIEVVTVCARKEIVADIGSRRELRDQLVQQHASAEEKEVLDKLRRRAIIEYR